VKWLLLATSVENQAKAFTATPDHVDTDC
jgi:hypothetical protein